MDNIPHIVAKPANTAPVRASGCVLAGGKSRRMGVDKALLALGGKTLIEHAVSRLAAAGFAETLISANDPAAYAFTGIAAIPDGQGCRNAGPLGGFIAALKAARAEYVCFRPVDAPLAPSALHLMLTNAALSGNRQAAVPTFGGRPEPLFACLSKSALPVLDAQAKRGDFKARNIFALLDTAYLPLEAPEQAAALGDPAFYLLNANDPEAFALLKSAFPSNPQAQ